jgi:hypothetical protein
MKSVGWCEGRLSLLKDVSQPTPFDLFHSISQVNACMHCAAAKAFFTESSLPAGRQWHYRGKRTHACCVAWLTPHSTTQAHDMGQISYVLIAQPLAFDASSTLDE